MHRLSRIDRRFVVTLILIIYAIAPLSVCAQISDPLAPVKTAVVVFTKSTDVSDSKIHENMYKAFAARVRETNGIQVMDLKTALGSASSGLKDDQIKQLLAFTELIPYTDHIRRNLRVDGMLVADVAIFGKMGKNYYISLDLEYYDFRQASVQSIPVSAVDFKAEVDKDEFYTAAADEMIRRIQLGVPRFLPAGQAQMAEASVVCNKESKLFHSLQSHHLPAAPIAQEMSRSAAVSGGYSPCAICYPEAKKRLSPESTEAMLGAEVAGFIEYYYRVSNDPERHARLDRIGRKILADNHFTKRRYSFTALSSDEINALAAPAGYVYVTTGMMDAAESDDELASVIAHEIAHVEEEHGLNQYRRAERLATIGLLVSILTGTDLSILSDFVRELVLRGYDRDYELDADRYGYMYARRTKYDPEAMFTVLGKLYDMELASNVKLVSWMRTHPKSNDRVKAVTEYKDKSSAASTYLSALGPVDPGLADAVRTDELRYIERADEFRKYVEVMKVLP